MSNGAAKQNQTVKLGFRYQAPERRAIIGFDDEAGDCFDVTDDLVLPNEDQFIIYAIPEEDEEDFWEGGTTDFPIIATVDGCLIPHALIEALGVDPHELCDDLAGDLEAMYSALEEHGVFDDEDIDNIYYINEITINDPEYVGRGYEQIILKHLPGLILKCMRVMPSLLAYLPPVAKAVEAHELSDEAREVAFQHIKYNSRNNNISYFPPKRALTPAEVNRVMGIRNPGDTIPGENRDYKQYAIYESAGFEEAGNSGWLYLKVGDLLDDEGDWDDDDD
ncbi:hypothetical protein FACS1894184_09130 [Clostridia bacterium]|nr:hypothetical protein FACS1894184_09130 [Clostridia bacterium]